VKTRTTTTAATQPLGRFTTAVERIFGGVTWATQAAAAATYLAAAGHPTAWQTILNGDLVPIICMCVFVIGLIAIWVASMWGEQTRFYNRLEQRSLRRVGLTCHLGVVLIAALAVSANPNRAGWWSALGFLCFSAFATWVSWMEIKFLPDEDQAVIDAIIAGEAAQRAAVYDASEREHRRVRLTAIVESLGYVLTDTPAQVDEPAAPPAVRWTIPAGKHAPLVYFIRNGNRVKIGTTTELKRRIRTLALRPENVALLIDGDRRREREYHKQFAEHRIGTTEWFAYAGTLTDYVNDQARRVSQKGREK
jgi:hypothetical protein